MSANYYFLPSPQAASPTPYHVNPTPCSVATSTLLVYLLYVHPSPAVPPKPNSCIHVAFTRSTASQAPLHFPSPTHTLSVPLRLPCLTLHGSPQENFPHTPPSPTRVSPRQLRSKTTPYC
ncbi:hypothetical protein Pcinc_026276 [Petrolisthes cinctipes]|uniref:Uncharacterized protein n=1 Tax=Petrolisthes cinctipes TaxID=88211 RepID=A0AAE1F7R1_PETCI|nr:hypothetical protein Pcinc_026276 [Petrolisthes cinctipes]